MTNDNTTTTSSTSPRTAGATDAPSGTEPADGAARPGHPATLPLYLLATGASLLGNSAIAIVLPWLVLQRTGDPAAAGLVATISAVPSAVASFAGGHLIDRVGRRRMSVISDIGSAVSVAALILVDATRGLDLTWFIVLGVLGALFDAPGMTARETLVADVARTSGVGLDKISAARGALFGVAFLLGPAIAGALLAVLPATTVVWLTAGSSALAALAVAVMPLDPRTVADDEDRSPFAGIVYVRRHRGLLALLIVQLGSMLLVTPLLSVVLPAHFAAMSAPSQLGLTLSAYAVGSVIGSGLYGWGFDGKRWAAWVTAQILFIASGVLVATLQGFWMVALGLLVAGVGSGLLQPIVTVILTREVPDALRGRVFATYSSLALVAAPIGLAAVTAVLSRSDLRAAAWLLAAGWVIVSAYAVLAPGLREATTGSDDADGQETR